MHGDGVRVRAGVVVETRQKQNLSIRPGRLVEQRLVTIGLGVLFARGDHDPRVADRRARLVPDGNDDPLHEGHVGQHAVQIRLQCFVDEIAVDGEIEVVVERAGGQRARLHIVRIVFATVIGVGGVAHIPSIGVIAVIDRGVALGRFAPTARAVGAVVCGADLPAVGSGVSGRKRRVIRDRDVFSLGFFRGGLRKQEAARKGCHQECQGDDRGPHADIQSGFHDRCPPVWRCRARCGSRARAAVARPSMARRFLRSSSLTKSTKPRSGVFNVARGALSRLLLEYMVPPATCPATCGGLLASPGTVYGGVGGRRLPTRRSCAYATFTRRPTRRFRLMIFRPPGVRIRARKPHLRLRLILLMRCG